jgi:predicted RNase H-like nuclease (RuvC/YqgF family)
MNSQIDDLQRGFKKLQEDRSNDNENFDKDIKQMKIDILNAQTNHNFENEEEKKKPKKESSDTSENISINYKNGINDRFSKIQATLQNCVTDSELKRFKNEIKDKLKELEKEDENIRKEIKDEFQGILVLFDKKSEQISDL